MRVRAIKKNMLYVLDEKGSFLTHRMLVRVVDVGLRGIITWEDPIDYRRGWLNARHILRLAPK